MIENIWKPNYKMVKGKRTIYQYDMVNDFSDIKKGWKVSYFCDVCKSKTLNYTTTSVLLNPNVIYNTMDNQTCRSCRTSISEYEIKKNFITYDIVESSIVSEGYEILDDSSEYNLSKNKSQYKINVICPNNHSLKITWNNWNKGKRCRKCYEDNRVRNAVKYKDGWELYKFIVWRETEKNYKKYYSLINPNNLKRGSNHHLDHKFSISEGFKNKIEPKIIASIGNLEIINSKDNMSKGSKCSLTIKKLLENSEESY